MTDHTTTPATKEDLFALLCEAQAEACLYKKLLDDLLNYLLLTESSPARAARDW